MIPFILMPAKLEMKPPRAGPKIPERLMAEPSIPVDVALSTFFSRR